MKLRLQNWESTFPRTQPFCKEQGCVLGTYCMPGTLHIINSNNTHLLSTSCVPKCFTERESLIPPKLLKCHFLQGACLDLLLLLPPSSAQGLILLFSTELSFFPSLLLLYSLCWFMVQLTHRNRDGLLLFFSPPFLLPPFFLFHSRGHCCHHHPLPSLAARGTFTVSPYLIKSLQRGQGPRNQPA